MKSKGRMKEFGEECEREEGNSSPYHAHRSAYTCITQKTRTPSRQRLEPNLFGTKHSAHTRRQRVSTIQEEAALFYYHTEKKQGKEIKGLSW